MPTTAEQEKHTSPPSPQRSGWPEDLAYRSWKMWTIRVFISLVVVAGVFGLGLWYGLGKGMATGDGGGSGHVHAAVAAEETILYWSCSMHPQIRLPEPGKCPICFMDLTPVRAGGEAEGGDAPRLTLSERARELARVETAPVELREATVDVHMVGKVMPDETLITTISSYIPGRLDRLFVDYTGILVRKGDHLAEVYSPDLLVAQREYLLGLEAVERAERAGGSENERSTARTLFEAARRKLELWGVPKDELEQLARERRPSDHMRIDAPLEGWVIERNAYEGMYVETGTRIFTLADLRTVWVMLDAYELDIGYVRLGQEVEFETEAYPGQVFKGPVSYVAPVLNAETRTVKVRVNVDNPDLKLRPGMFVRASLKARLGEGGAVVENVLAGKWICPMHPEVVKDGPGQCDKCGMDLVPAEKLGYVTQGAEPAKLLTVPTTAVLLTGKRAVVYVEQKQDDGTPVYEGRVITLGPQAGDYYVVRDGLKEGERVVTRGALMIDSAMQIHAKPSMMQPAAADGGHGAGEHDHSGHAGHASQDGQEEHGHEHAGHDAHGAAPPRFVAGAGYHQRMAPAIEAYLQLQHQLTKSDATRAAEALGRLRAALREARPEGLTGEAAERFTTLLKQVAAALPEADKPTLAAMREKLPAITAAVEAYLRTFGHNRSEPLVRHFCPMAFDNKGAAWLQADHDTRNPYLPEEMLKCGVIEHTIEADGRIEE